MKLPTQSFDTSDSIPWVNISIGSVGCNRFRYYVAVKVSIVTMMNIDKSIFSPTHQNKGPVDLSVTTRSFPTITTAPLSHTITQFYSVLFFGILIIRTSPTSPCSAHHYYHHLHHQHVDKNNQKYRHGKTASGISIFKRFDINDTCLYIIGYCTLTKPIRR